MPEYPTQPAFVYDHPTHDFDEHTRVHPALKYIEDYVRNVAEKNWAASPEECNMHPEAFLKFGEGHVAQNAGDHHQVLQDSHSHFESFHCGQEHTVVVDTEDGWISTHLVKMYFNWAKDSVPAERAEPVKSFDGRTWDGMMKGAIRCHYIKGADGEVQLAGTEMYNSYMKDL